MARNIPNATRKSDPKPAPSEAMGVMPEAATHNLSPLLHIIPGKHAATPKPNGPPVRQYRVLQDAMILYDSSRSMMKAGKIISENTVDIALLQRQGVLLEDITPPAPPSAVVEEESASDEETDDSEDEPKA
jgi:hypothetical protein